MDILIELPNCTFARLDTNLAQSITRGGHTNSLISLVNFQCFPDARLPVPLSNFHQSLSFP
jgi:hypothetical protein